MKKNEVIRVAHIIGKWFGGGVESVVMNYYKYIDRNKIQFDFICDEDSTNIPYEEIESLGGRVILVPPYQKIFKYHRALKKILKENKYKIIHSHINTLSVFPLFAAKRAGVPVRISHSHSTIINNKRELKRNIIKNILKHFSKTFATDYYACSDLAAISQFGKNLVKDGKVTIINNAIDLEKYKYDEVRRKDKRKELNIEDNSFVIGHIGRFVETKNHTFIIDIFNEVHKRNNNSVLLLAGQGPLMEEVKIKVHNIGLEDSVIFLGQRKDANELYQAMDVFLLPSLYEGLPVVGIEAQAAGLLCILSDKMTKNAKVIETTKFVSLEKNENEWCNIIYDNYALFKRCDTRDEISKHGFNIREEVHKLENKYLEY